VKKWVALFSQTGSEIVRLSNELKRTPDHIITNNFDHTTWVKGLSDVSTMSPDAIYTWIRSTNPDDYFFTLHGYLRILPADICEKYEVYNGHPALITHYPELKGKDPQERTWENKDQYPWVGSVVHKCTPELDGGKVMYSVSYTNRCDNKEEMYNVLKNASFDAWKFFMRTYK
jgi:formyltetrahydrofolate hydrolase